MSIIVRAARIVDSKSPFHNQVIDAEIRNGIIKKIGKSIPNPDGLQEISFENLHLSQGWFDSSVFFGEPGYEDFETISNGLMTAAKSGYTAVALQPNTLPIIDNQSQVHFVKAKASGSAVDLFPIGALTKESAGKDMAEMYDMKNAGAVAFGDYAKCVSNANILKIALQYVQDFDALLIAFSQDSDLKGNGVVNEGIVSTQLGLKGIPALAEELQLGRNLSILEYTGGRLHIPTISTEKSVDLIKKAKAKGLRVSCSVTVHHLVMTDEKLHGFDTNYKVTPPLRTESDRKALLAGVLDGTIDMITSDHSPVDIEHKKVEFDWAKNGTIGLESAFGALLTVLPLEIVIQKLTAGREFFSIPATSINEGNAANLTLFNPDSDWNFGLEHILSKSKNSAFLGTKMKGKVHGIYNKGQFVLTNE